MALGLNSTVALTLASCVILAKSLNFFGSLYYKKCSTECGEKHRPWSLLSGFEPQLYHLLIM